ncbi:MAG: S8 family serine peptidase [Thermoleophilia bacterium]|nr:S8 family serine peptidase [Thermoleophilia bacterium]
MLRALPIALASASSLMLPHSASAQAITQGAFRMGADALWSQGFLGGGDRIAVVDEGFGGLDESIAAGELPPRDRMRTMSFDAAHGLGGRSLLTTDPTPHGTRMAEIIHDLAPQAELVLVNYNTVDEFVRATEWVADQGIPVASHSNSFLDGPFDGTGAAARAVDGASDRGVLWINSAGNFAERHWAGGADATGTAIPVPRLPSGWLDLHLSWRDPGTRASLTVELRDANGAWQPLATATPSGPVSVRVGPLQMGDGEYRLMVRRESGPDDELEVFSQSARFGAAAVASGSVATPADAHSAVAVGAVPWVGDLIAPYSSWGPTDDGRAKPELVAPTYVTSNPAFPGTAGTSAATAHVAGAALLLRRRRLSAGLDVTVSAMRDVLLRRTRDLGETGADPVFGHGLFRVDTAPPIVRMRFDARRRLLAVRAADNASLWSLVVRPAGRRATRTRRAYVRVRIPVRARSRRVVVAATDMARNRTVRTITVPGGP